MTRLKIISTSITFVGIACSIWANTQILANQSTATNSQQESLAQSPFTSNDKDAPDSTISGTTRSGLRTFVHHESV